jgi:trehalose monomycolate/heme transporter
MSTDTQTTDTQTRVQQREPTHTRPDRLGRTLQRLRWPILLVAAGFLILGAVWGTTVFGRLVGSGFDSPGSESFRAAERAEQAFGRQATDVAVIYSSDRTTVDDPAFAAAVQNTVASLPAGSVTTATTFWNSGLPALVSLDRHSSVVLLQLAGNDEQARSQTYERIADDLQAPGLDTYRGGEVALFTDVQEQVSEDLARAERLSLPVVLVLLVVIFGSLAAASLPLAIGGLGILGAFTVLNLISRLTDVSIFSINLVTMLGLGLAIDYALFIVSRFREELAAAGGTRDDVPNALGRTMRTAGRTVLFSGLTVAVSLAALLFFPQVFLRSMGYGAIAVVAVALVAALTVLPALLAVLGPRVNSLRVPRLGRRRSTGGAWERIAHAVMRRPFLIASGVVAGLILVGLPFLRVEFGGVDARVLPEGTESRVAAERLAADFPAASANPIDIVLTGATPGEAQDYATQLAELPGVTSARVTASAGDVSRVLVTYPGSQIDDSSRGLVTAVRDVAPPSEADALVGGPVAAQVDLLASIGDRLPWATLFVVAVTLVLLFLAFGSVVLPLKAIVMNVLSLSAMFGVMVWIFQDGHLADLFGVTVTGTIDATQPVLMVAIAFGLSMDYELFLLSRVREEWDCTRDNTRAVAQGLQRTGRIITSAALLLVVVIGAFATSGISFIAMIGVGLAVAIALDATVIRALLVPATMRLLGGANWWAPAPLRRIWERYGLERS